MRTLIVSSIDGNENVIKKLKKELKKDDKIVFLGNYINMFPNAKEPVLDELIKLQDKYLCVFISGRKCKLVEQLIHKRSRLATDEEMKREIKAQYKDFYLGLKRYYFDENALYYQAKEMDPEIKKSLISSPRFVVYPGETNAITQSVRIPNRKVVGIATYNMLILEENRFINLSN